MTEEQLRDTENHCIDFLRFVQKTGNLLDQLRATDILLTHIRETRWMQTGEDEEWK